MNIAVVFGTRPEIIRLSRIIPLLDSFCRVTLVHTGQNYDDRLSDLFFRELGVRTPDVHLGVRGGSFAEQAGQIL
jgi:UDP-N-acetylglucosamine 2-epimerase (non-hydrolysing)